MSSSPSTAESPFPGPLAGPHTDGARLALLRVSLLDDLDLVPTDHGVLLEVPGRSPVALSYAAARQVVGRRGSGSAEAEVRLRSWLRMHRAVAALGDDAADALRTGARALAVAPGTTWDAGPWWRRVEVRGGALEVGLGVLHPDLAETGAPGPDGHPATCAQLLWPDVAAAAGLEEPELAGMFRRALEHAERMGALTAARLRREDPEAPGVLRPVDGCDVMTLLTSPTLRREIATSDGTGMRPVSVPDRSRGWFDTRRLDPAFVGAAWSATEPAARGVADPMLVTPDDVLLVVRATRAARRAS